jgi:O-antigen/teichoic acid export membrane protein
MSVTGEPATDALSAFSSVGTTRRNVIRVLRSGAAVAVLSAPLNVLVLPFVLHRVSIVGYGEWATLSAVFSIVQLADAGISTDIARRVADAYGRRSDEALREAVQRGMTVLTALAGFMVMAAALASGRVIDLLFPTVPDHERQTILLVYLAMLALIGLSLVLSGYLAALGGLQRLDVSTWGSLAGLIAGTIATVLGAGLHLGLWALFAGAFARSIVGWTFSLIGLRRLMPDLRFRFQRVGFRDSLSYLGMPAMLLVASLGNIFEYQVDKFVLSHFRGARYAGLYQLGLNLVTQAQILALIPLGVLLAATAELHRSNPAKLRRLEGNASAACLSTGAVILGALIAFSDSFYRIWLGPRYDASAHAAKILAVAALIALVAAPWYFYMLGRVLYRFIVVVALTNLVVNLACTIALTPRLGINGALIGTAAGNGIALVVNWYLLRRVDQRSWILPAFRPYVAVGIVTAGAVGLQHAGQPHQWITLFASVAVFVLTAAFALFLAGAAPVRIEREGLRLKLSLVDDPHTPQAS